MEIHSDIWKNMLDEGSGIWLNIHLSLHQVEVPFTLQGGLQVFDIPCVMERVGFVECDVQ